MSDETLRGASTGERSGHEGFLRARDEGLAWLYRFGPFLLQSEIEIPELRGVEGSGRLLVTVRSGGVPRTLAGSRPFGSWCCVSPVEYLLDIEGIARFYVGQGRDVRVEMVPGTPISDVSTYLLGSVFGALCHQNGLLPLHASAVESAGTVTAFLGDSGAGKSTTAASLQRRGYPIVSDDICLLEPAGERMQVVPVAGWLKLWRESLDHLGESAEERNRTFSSDDKFRVYLAQRVGSPGRIANLVFLAKAEGPAQEARLEELSACETLAGMLEMTYLSYVVELTGAEPDLFRRCAGVLRGAKGYRLTVPWGWEQLESVVDLVESRLLRGPGG